MSGPAYGLVAAYHQLYSEDTDGNVRLGGDQGIRMHGSVDYMSIMRRHSHGCHRLHNHIAVRLMSWVLAHRHHVVRSCAPHAVEVVGDRRKQHGYGGHTRVFINAEVFR